MTRDMWQGVARHILGSAGAVLVALGYMDAGTAEMLVGATVTVGATVWSIIDKKQR
jgi:hypothetical protein